MCMSDMQMSKRGYPKGKGCDTKAGGMEGGREEGRRRLTVQSHVPKFQPETPAKPVNFTVKPVHIHVALCGVSTSRYQNP
jgi:hypothetical protein